jgi:ribokinase
MTQFEVPLPAVEESLRIARAHGVTNILNPAPAAAISPELYALADVLTPNGIEAAALCGRAVGSLAEAESAADFFLDQGVGAAIITLGADGALVKSAAVCEHVPAFSVGAVVETTGAGDAFNGALAVALSEDRSPVDAVRFACAAAGISVTRPGTAQSMPTRTEIDAILSGK